MRLLRSFSNRVNKSGIAWVIEELGAKGQHLKNPRFLYNLDKSLLVYETYDETMLAIENLKSSATTQLDFFNKNLEPREVEIYLGSVI